MKGLDVLLCLGLLSAVVNLVIDRGFRVPADSAPEWAAFVTAHPRWAGVVKFWRGAGPDMLKLAHAFIMTATGNPAVDPSQRNTRPPGPPDAPKLIFRDNVVTTDRDDGPPPLTFAIAFVAGMIFYFVALTGCAASQNPAKLTRVTVAALRFSSETRMRLVRGYELEQLHCLQLPEPERDPCIQRERAAWNEYTEIWDEMRDAACDLVGNELVCAEQAEP